MWVRRLHLARLAAASGVHASAATTTTTNITSGLPTVSLFLPMADPSQLLAASIVTAEPNGTVYVIGCLPTVDAADCGFSPPVTVTEDDDSLRFTMSYNVGDDLTDSSLLGSGSTSASSAPLEITSNCQLYGAPRATSAVCTGNNAVSGLGNAASSTTLASSELNYMPVIITAGAQKTSMAAAATASTAASSATSLGSAAMGPVVQNLAIGAGLIAARILI
ncbi:Hypothetical protein R9X50_00105400 [Acrodontium crateriforme]|uniref:GPI anchored protein n=1 Tax=Acrodontium crateriforme TaxID=150365 RepID=A0AAQ3LZE2_9PEZI|nr:Hypothetical protein R9X50_00105400 [Acrodontium crateriforme]